MTYAIPDYNTPVLAAPRIPYATFLARLKSKNSPAVPQAKQIYDGFIASGVDPSFALAQYRVESQYGTAGHAVMTKSWGNMLWDSSLCLHAAGQYSPGNGYTYAKYNDVYSASLDYAHYLHDYAENRNLHSIYAVTAEWIGKPPGSSGHISYVNIIINDMIAYELQPGEFYEAGDKMIFSHNISTDGKIHEKYPVVKDKTVLYRGTSGDILKTYTGPSGLAWFTGLVQGSKTWGTILIKTEAAGADPAGYTTVYIKNIDTTKIVKV